MSDIQPGHRAAGTLTGGTEWDIRPCTHADIPAIAALINAADAVDKTNTATTEESLTQTFREPRFDPACQAVVAVTHNPLPLPPHELAGYGRIVYLDDEENQTRNYWPEITVHPAARGTGLEQEIARTLLDFARSREAGAELRPGERSIVKAYVHEGQAYLHTLYRTLGFREVRRGWVMSRPLDEPVDEPAAIEGLDFRNVRLPDDTRPLLDAYADSFVDHWDYMPEPAEDWEFWLSGKDMRPDLSWVAVAEGDEGKIAGFSLCEIDEDKNRRLNRREGWVELLGTIRGWRRVGLGRALLLHSLLSLRSAGMDIALLEVDSESPTGANRLYESVGFRIRDCEIQYDADLRDIKI